MARVVAGKVRSRWATAHLRGAARWANRYVVPLLMLGPEDIVLRCGTLSRKMDAVFVPDKRVIIIRNDAVRFREMLRIILVHELVHVEQYDVYGGACHGRYFTWRQAWVWKNLFDTPKAMASVLYT